MKTDREWDCLFVVLLINLGMPLYSDDNNGMFGTRLILGILWPTVWLTSEEKYWEKVILLNGRRLLSFMSGVLSSL